MKMKVLALCISLTVVNTQADAFDWKQAISTGCDVLFVGLEFTVAAETGGAGEELAAEAAKKAAKKGARNAAVTAVGGSLACGGVGMLLGEPDPISMAQVKNEIAAEIDANNFKTYVDKKKATLQNWKNILTDDSNYEYKPGFIKDDLLNLHFQMRDEMWEFEKADHDQTTVYIYAAMARLHLAVLNHMARMASEDPNMNAQIWVNEWASFNLRYSLFSELLAETVFSQLAQREKFKTTKANFIDYALFQCNPHGYDLPNENLLGNNDFFQFKKRSSMGMVNPEPVGWHPTKPLSDYEQSYRPLRELDTYNRSAAKRISNMTRRSARKAQRRVCTSSRRGR